MPFPVQTSFFNYFTQSPNKVRDAVLKLSDLGQELGRKKSEVQDENYEQGYTVWSLVDNLKDFLEGMAGEDGNWDINAYEQKAILMFDADLVEETEKNLQLISRVLQGEDVGATGEQISPASTDFNQLELSQQSESVWKRMRNNLSPENTRVYELLVSTLCKQLKRLKFLLLNINTVCGIISPIPQPYAMEEVEQIFFNGLNGYNNLRFSKTLIESAKDENWQTVASLITGYLKSPAFLEKNKYNWDEALVLVLFLHLVYSRFERMPPEVQQTLLATSAFCGLTAGAPVEEGVKEALYQTRDVVEYSFSCWLFSEGLRLNYENIPGDTKGESHVLFSDLLPRYHASASEPDESGFKQTNFIEQFYSGQLNREYFISWMKKYFSLFYHLKNGDIVDHNWGGELFKKEEFFNDMIRLLAMMGIGESGADEIVKYFKNPQHLVPFNTFIKRFRDTALLEAGITCQNILEVTPFLHKNGILPPEQEIIEYHESDGSFHWSERVSKL